VPQVVIFALVFISGCAGLAHEIIWLRLFSLTFGNTAPAGAAVVGAFLAGLALGAWWFGNRADASPRPYRLFGLLQLGVAAAAALVLAGRFGADAIYTAIFRWAGPGSAFVATARVVFCFLLLAIPSALMGASLPALARAARPKAEEAGKQVGRLFAAFTFGAAAGALLTTHLLIRALGVYQTAFAAVACNALAGLAALAFFRREAPSALPTEPARTKHRAAPERTAWLALLLVAAGALVAFGIEAMFFRLVVLKSEATTYLWAKTIALYLAGLAAGAAAMARRSEKTAQPLHAGAAAVVWAAIFAWAIIVLLTPTPEILAAAKRVFGRGSFVSPFAVQFDMVWAAYFLVAFFTGGAVPPLVRAFFGDALRPARRTGLLVAAGALGGLGGLGGAGFLFLPVCGAQWTLFGAAGFAFLAGAAALFLSAAKQARHLTPVAIGLIVAAFAIIRPTDDLLPALFEEKSPGDQVRYAKEDAAAAVVVVGSPERRWLYLNGEIIASAGDLTPRLAPVVQLHMLALAHPHPQDALLVGFGSGETARMLTLYDLRRLDVAEPYPGVFEAASQFDDLNHDIQADKKLRKIIMDGRNYVHLSADKYDLIALAAAHPRAPGAAGLYTREAFAAARDRLRDDGVMSCAVPLFLLGESAVKSMMRSFVEVFPNSILVFPHVGRNGHALLIGKKGSGPFYNYQRLAEQMANESIKAHLDELKIKEPLDLINFILLGRDQLAAYAHEATVSTDNRPYLEFAALADVGNIASATYTAILSGMMAQRGDPLAVVDLAGVENKPDLLAAQRDRYVAVGLVLDFMAGKWRGAAAGRELLANALRLSPGVLGADKPPPEPGPPPKNAPVDPATALFGRTTVSDSRLGKVREYLQTGKLSEAEKMLAQELKDNPDSLVALATMGEVQFQKRDYGAVISYFARVHQLDPHDAAAVAKIGEAYFELGDFAQAKGWLAAVLETAGPNPEIYARLAIALRRTGEAAQADDLFRTALTKFPKSAKMQMFYGYYLGDAGRDREAEQALRKALELDPQDTIALGNLGLLYMRQKRLPEARAVFQRVLEIRPDDRQARSLLMQLGGMVD
jgi:Tfp pilus assembly protein PilF/predicted membrane-bound spermidine synthase